MKILVIPTTDWTGHPVPNRLNFIFDRLAKKHDVDVCHFKLFGEKRRDTDCDLIPMDKGAVGSDVQTYYLSNFTRYGKKLADIAGDYDCIVSSNIIPGAIASIQDTHVILDYLDHFPQSASMYYDGPLSLISKTAASWITDFNLKKADGIITTTEIFKKMLSKRTDVPIRVVENGVDTDKIKRVNPEYIEKRFGLKHPVIGYVGSLERWIDLESVIKLMPTILKRYKNTQLFIVGSSLHTDFSNHLKDVAEDIGVEKNIIFTGLVSYEHLARYISAIDVGINPREPLMMNSLTMGSKVLNYLACGVPVLNKNMPAVEELFGPEDGVFGYRNDDEFMGELHKALAHEVDSSVVKKFDWDELAEKYEKTIYGFLE